MTRNRVDIAFNIAAVNEENILSGCMLAREAAYPENGCSRRTEENEGFLQSCLCSRKDRTPAAPRPDSAADMGRTPATV